MNSDTASKQDNVLNFSNTAVVKPVSKGDTIDIVSIERYKSKKIKNESEKQSSSSNLDVEEVIKSIPKNYKPRHKDNKQTRLLNKWVGKVEEVSGDRFIAKLVDKTDTSGQLYNEVGEFSIVRNVKNEDINLVKPGAVFYWTISSVYDYEKLEPYTKENIKFKRVPTVTKKLRKRIDGIKNELLRRIKRNRTSTT